MKIHWARLPAALEAARECLSNVELYPDGSGFHLKQALSKHLNVSSECMTLGNGSNDVLVLLAETFLTPGAEAVFDEHAFIIYRLAVQAAGGIAQIAPSNPPDGPQSYGHDLSAFSERLNENTRLVFIANPNNPTGTWLARENLHAFLRGVPEAAIVVIDEAYFEYVEAPDYPNAGEWLGEFPNLVVTRTFSKIYGLAGLRVGYALSNPAVAELLNRVRQPFNVNGVGLAAATAALSDQAFVLRARELNLSGIRQLSSGLTDIGFTVVPSAGNFVLADMGRAAAPIYEALLRTGIIVRPVGNYGLPNHLRISVGLPEQNDRLLAELRTIR